MQAPILRGRRCSPAMALPQARRCARLFSPEGAYLNTATYGLPPRTAIEATSPPTSGATDGPGSPAGTSSVGRARAAFARLARVEHGDVAIGSAVSAFAASSARRCRPARASSARRATSRACSSRSSRRGAAARGARPARAARRGARAASRPRRVLRGAERRRADRRPRRDRRRGRRPRRAHVRRHDAVRGWLPLDHGASTTRHARPTSGCSSPRGTAYFTLRPELRDELLPHDAGWYAGEDPSTTYYGAPLRLAADARRFDLSPAWHCWVGAAPAVELFAELGLAAIGRHDVAIANRLPGGLGQPPGDSAIVSAGGLPAGRRRRGSGRRASWRRAAAARYGSPATSTRRRTTSSARSPGAQAVDDVRAVALVVGFSRRSCRASPSRAARPCSRAA